MEKGIIVGLAVVLFAAGTFLLILLLRGPSLYGPGQQGEPNVRNEKVASRLMTLTLIWGALMALAVAAWSVL